MTTSFSRGISTLRFLRLCWRAPMILITCAGIRTTVVEPLSQAQGLLFSTQIDGMSEKTISDAEPKEVQAKYSELKHSENNALPAITSLTERPQRRPDHAE